MTNDSESQLPADAAEDAADDSAAVDAVPRARLPELLHAAVASVGGVERPGQARMAEAVADAVDHNEHLLVQAGTGTGKSLAYLVPALAHGDRVVVATATLALQRQLVERDLPRTVDALHPVLRRRPLFAMLKGRSNYLCLHRANEGTPSEEGEGLFDPVDALGGPTGKLGKDVLRLRDWADETETGTGTTSAPASPTRPGPSSPSPPRSAWAPPAARTGRSASRRRPASGPSSRTWWSPTTRCWRSTPSRAPRCCPSTGC